MNNADNVVREIEGLNQRGGRMLTAVDLLEAGTVDLPLMAYLLHAVGQGASILTCAGPGGTGKTTLLGALLCFLPADAALKVVEGPRPLSWYDRQASHNSRVWFLCHELGAGPWYSYLWGEAARAFLEMPARGENRYCATTVHADSLDELRKVLEGPEIGISREAFAGLDLILFMQAGRKFGTGGVLRRVTGVFVGTGDPAKSHYHLCRWDKRTDSFLWQAGDDVWVPDPKDASRIGRSLPSTTSLEPYLDFLRHLQRRRIVDVIDVRREVVRFYREDV